MVTRATIASAVEIFDRLRARHGSEVAMEQAIEFATDAGSRTRITARASGVDPVVAALVEAVARHHRFALAHLRGRTRSLARVIQVRDEAVYVARAVTGASYPELGRLLRRDSSTLVAGGDRFTERLAVDEVLAARVAKYVAGCRGEAVAVGEAVAA